MRLLASLLAALIWCGPLLTTAHLAAVQHVSCAEHGEEMMEVVAQDAASSNSIAPDGRGDAHDHDHCLLASERTRHHQALGTHDLSSACDVVASNLAPPLFTTPHLSIDLLRLAPKVSPPV